MFELMLMRHAKSDWHSHSADIDRPLNKRGAANAERMGRFLQQRKMVPDSIIASPARRTQQTAEQLLLGFASAAEIRTDRELYLAGSETLREIAGLYARPGQRLMILAHNPGMDSVVSYLSSELPALTDNGKLMTTCAVACFRLASVEDLDKPGKAELSHLFRPKEI